jgi:hypothetical protein
MNFGGKAFPGVLIDLSAGGVSLLAYTSFPLGTELSLTINLPGLETKPLNGHVVWVIPKAEMWRMGIAFTEVDHIDFRHINRMAFDFTDCEKKLSLGVSDVCVEKCSYFNMCSKPVKLKK